MPLVHEVLQRHGRPHLRLRADDGASAEISLFGAHVTSWQPAPGRERLYLSPNAAWREGAAIRGGIPVIFPQFGGRGPLTKHGFARTLDWAFTGLEPSPHGPAAALELRDSDATRAIWPHRFLARVHVALAPGALHVGLEVRNDDQAPLSFTAALHTYLRVDALSGTTLLGLETSPFLDSTRGDTPTPPSGEPPHFGHEIDRIYPDTRTATVVLADGAHRVRIGADDLPDTVVWNPGPTLAAALSDLGAGEHEHFVCVESAAVIAPVVLAPGASWTGWQHLTDETP